MKDVKRKVMGEAKEILIIAVAGVISIGVLYLGIRLIMLAYDLFS